MAGLLRGFSGRWVLLVLSAVSTASWAAPASVSPANATLAPSSPVTPHAQTGGLNVSRVVSTTSHMSTAAAWLSHSARAASATAAEAIAAAGRNATVAYTIAAATTHAARNSSARESTKAVDVTRSASEANVSAATVKPATTTQILRNYSSTTERRPVGDTVTSAGLTTATRRPNLPLVTVGNTTSSFVTGKATEATAGGRINSSGGSVAGSSPISTAHSLSTSLRWTTLRNRTSGVSLLALTTRSQTEGQRVTSGPTITSPFSRLNFTAFTAASQATTVALGGASTLVVVPTLRTTAAASVVSGGGGSGRATAAQVYSPNGTATASRNASFLTSSGSPTFRSLPSASGATTHSDGGQSSTGWTPYTTRRTKDISLLTSLRAASTVTGATSTNFQTLITSARTARPLNATAGVSTPTLSSSFRSTPSALESDSASVKSSRSVIDGAKVTFANASRPLPAWELTTSVGSSVSRGSVNGTANTGSPSSPQASATHAWTSTAPAMRASASTAIVPVNGSGVRSVVASTPQSLKLTSVAYGGTSRKSFTENATSVAAVASEPPPTRQFLARAVVSKSSLLSTVATPSVSSAAPADSRSSGGSAAATTFVSSAASATTVTRRLLNVTAKVDPPASLSFHVHTSTRASMTAPSRSDGTTAYASLDAVAAATHPHAVASATVSYISSLRAAVVTVTTMALRPSNASASAAVSYAASTAPLRRSSGGGSSSTANSLRTTRANATSVGSRISTPPPTVVTTAMLINRQSTVHTAPINSSFGSTPAATTSLPRHRNSTTLLPLNVPAIATRITTTVLSRSSGGGSIMNSLTTAGVNTTTAGARISTLTPSPTVAATATQITSRQSTVHSAPPNSSFGSTRQAASSATAAVAAAATASPPSLQYFTTPPAPSNATASAMRVATHSPPQYTTSVNRSVGIVTLQLSAATAAAAVVTTGRLQPGTTATISGGTLMPPVSAVVTAPTTQNVASASVNVTLRKATAVAGSTDVYLRTTLRAESVNSTAARPIGGGSSPPSLRTLAATLSTHQSSFVSPVTNAQASRTSGVSDATATLRSRNLTGSGVTSPRQSEAAEVTAAASTVAVSRGIDITTTGPPGRISRATNATLLSPASMSHPTTSIFKASAAATVTPSRQSTAASMAGGFLVGGSTVITNHTLPPQTRQRSDIATTRFFVGGIINSVRGSAGGVTISGLSSRVIVNASTVSPGTFAIFSNATLARQVEGGGITSGVPSLRTPDNALTTTARQPTASAVTGSPGPRGTARPPAQNATNEGISTTVATPSQPLFNTGNATRLPPSPPATASSYSPSGRQASGAAASSAMVAFAAIVTSGPPLGGASGSWPTRVTIGGAATETTAAASEHSARAANATTLFPDGIWNASGGIGSSSATSAALTAGGTRPSSSTLPVALTTTNRARMLTANQTVSMPAPSLWPASGVRATFSAVAAISSEWRLNNTVHP